VAATGDERERAVPILTVLDLDEAARFYARLGFEVESWYRNCDYDHGYVIMKRRPSTELHLSRFPGHDPHVTAGSIYLRVTDPQALYDALRAELAREGVLYPAPASGLTPELTAELRAKVATGERLVRLHEIEDKPWGMREFTVVDPAGNAVRVGQVLDR
jgi:catechol 2,3-dioxygenase-like lactoylglutathione lyase family enzyme